MIRRFLVLALVCFSVACATGARHKLTVTVATSHQVLSSVQDVEMASVCGRPTAPIPPLCVEQTKHQTISEFLAEAFDYNGKMASLVKALPPNATPTTSQITELLSKIADLVQKIMASLPDNVQQRIAERNPK